MSMSRCGGGELSEDVMLVLKLLNVVGCCRVEVKDRCTDGGEVRYVFNSTRI